MKIFATVTNAQIVFDAVLMNITKTLISLKIFLNPEVFTVTTADYT